MAIGANNLVLQLVLTETLFVFHRRFRVLIQTRLTRVYMTAGVPGRDAIARKTVTN
jgi:hypothetical protein